MKSSDFIFKYSIGRNTSICRVRNFTVSSGALYTVVSGLGEHSLSGSITDAIELIAVQLAEYGYIAGITNIIEHYEATTWKRQTFDLVSFDDGGSPDWTSVSIEYVTAILECDDKEFAKNACEIERLYSQIEKASHEINPFAGVRTVYNKKFEARKYEIEKSKKSRNELASLISQGASERELQKFLKEDMTFFAEMYAKPEDEYICFSEFPVVGGYVDFVVMTGRSRMDVILIEIKGANFPVQTSNSYNNFTAKFNECVQQARRRVGDVYLDMESFRKHVHEIREEVESGKSRYNSFVGPSQKLQVSSDKDINIRTVTIAGRGVNGPEESRRRQFYERDCSPPMKIESWTSWFAKLKNETEP